MAMSEVTIPPTEKRNKWGLFGKIAGMIAGGLAAPLTGGASLAGTAAAAGLGGTAGEVIGSLAGKSKSEPGMGVSTLQRAALRDPDVQMGFLSQGQKDLMGDMRIPHEDRQSAWNTLEEAKKRLQETKARMGYGTGSR